MKGKLRRLYLLFGVALLTTNIVSGCGAAKKHVEKAENLKEDKHDSEDESEALDLTDYYQDEVRNMESDGYDEQVDGEVQKYGDFNYVICEKDGERMYCFTLEHIPDFEFWMDEEQAIGTVVYRGESLELPLEEEIFSENEYGYEYGYGSLSYGDMTGDGVDDFIYSSEQLETWKDTDVEIYQDDIVIVDLENMQIITCEDLQEVSEIPENFSVTIVGGVGEGTQTIVTEKDMTEEELSDMYVFQMGEGGRYGCAYSSERLTLGMETELEITSIYIGFSIDFFGAIIYYGFPGEYSTGSCVEVKIPYRYHAGSGRMEFAEEEVTGVLTTPSYVFEAMAQEGQVVELEERTLDELLLYGDELSEIEAIGNLFSSEWYTDRSGQRELYHVTYPNSRDKSAVYLVTLRANQGYLYVYEEGIAHQDEAGEWKYLWYVKEVAYTSELPQSLQ